MLETSIFSFSHNDFYLIKVRLILSLTNDSDLEQAQNIKRFGKKKVNPLQHNPDF